MIPDRGQAVRSVGEMLTLAVTMFPKAVWEVWREYESSPAELRWAIVSTTIGVTRQLQATARQSWVTIRASSADTDAARCGRDMLVSSDDLAGLRWMQLEELGTASDRWDVFVALLGAAVAHVVGLDEAAVRSRSETLAELGLRIANLADASSV